jgi:hypothetical protein
MDKKNIAEDLTSQGYSILQGLSIKNSSWCALLETPKTDFEAFFNSWNDLPPDDFLSDGGHYRFRRYSVFHWQKGKALTLLPHESHYQSTYRNNLNGGIYREFEAFDEKTIANPLVNKIVDFVVEKISFNDEKEWRVQAHQFRIVANVDEAGQPTPEGIHRDGADFILIMVLNRHNITGAVNHIYDDAKRLVLGGILENQGDALLIDDRKVWHGVSEVYPEDENQSAYRDVLVLTFHNKITQ